jgi:hypothetical protein
MIGGTPAALAAGMRTTSMPTIQIHELVHVTGGCGKKQAPPPPRPTGPSVDVTVATGAAGGQAIQQALQSF